MGKSSRNGAEQTWLAGNSPINGGLEMGVGN